MKTTALLTVIATVMVLCSWSCSTDTQEPQIENPEMVSLSTYNVDLYDEAFVDLNDQLQKLNDKYPSETLERGRFWNWFKRIVFGDFLGACLGAGTTWSPAGAIFFGIWGSINGALYEYNVEGGQTKYNIERPSMPASWNPLVVNQGKYAGAIHNRVIYETFNDLGDDIYTCSSDVLRSKIIEKMGKYVIGVNLNIAQLNNPQIEGTLLTSLSNYDITESRVLLNQVVTFYPARVNEIQTLTIFSDKYSEFTSMSTKDAYVSEFLDIVDNSNITNDSKAYILSGVDVAHYSDKLWKKADGNEN